MNEQQNTQVVQQAYAAFQRRDIAGVLAALDENVDWHSAVGAPPAVPFAGQRRGREAVREFFASVTSHMNISLFEPKQYIAQGNLVVALGRYGSTVASTGRYFETDFVMAFTLKNGKVVRFQEFTDTYGLAKAFDALTETETTEARHDFQMKR